MMDVMLEQGDDPRAMHIVWKLGRREDGLLAGLERAAASGYGPAMASMSMQAPHPQKFEWAEKAVASGDRCGFFLLARMYKNHGGIEKATELYKVAAELGHSVACAWYGSLAFGPMDWQRYYWLARAAARGTDALLFCEAVSKFLPSFEARSLGRILHTVGATVRDHLDVAKLRAFGHRLKEDEIAQLQRVVELYGEMLDRARDAAVTWVLVGRRCGVAKDIRVLIAKMLWKEAWRWNKD
jgi:hypothetical protein